MSYESLHTRGHVASTEVFPSRVFLVESGPGIDAASRGR